ncbi:MAG: two-component regulator propeller domain-containing protein [Bacteroidota bacterium]
MPILRSDRTSIAGVFLLLMLHIGTSAPASSQILPFRSYTIKEGLSSNQVNHIFQDSKGFIWIGTNNGLSLFDSRSFTNYTSLNGLAENDIVDIAESPLQPGILYFLGAHRTLTVFRDGRFLPITCNRPPNDRRFDAIAADPGGFVWGISDGLLFKIKNDTATAVELSSPGLDNSGPPRLLPVDGGIWIADGTEFRLFRFTNPKHLAEAQRIHFPDDIYYAMNDAEGNIFVSLKNNMLFQIRNGSIVSHRKIPVSDAYGTSWIRAGRGILWITSHEGLFSIAIDRFDTDPIRSYSVNNGLPDKIISDIIFDYEGNLWVATWTQGIALLSNWDITYIPLDNTTDFRVATMDLRGNLWISSENNVWELFPDKNGTWNKTLHPLSGLVWDLCFDHDGDLWIGFYNWVNQQSEITGFSRYSIERKDNHTALRLVKSFKYPSNLPKLGGIYEMHVDSRNRLWCSINPYGVAVFDLNTMKQIAAYMPGVGAPDNSPRAIYEDREGRIWLGGFSRGLALIDGTQPLTGEAKIFTEQDGLPDNRIRAIREDSKGRIWLGTRGHGAAVYDHGRFISLSMKDGILSETVWSITEENNSRIWLGTSLGVQSVDESTLQVHPIEDELRSTKVVKCGTYSNKSVWFVTAYQVTVYESGKNLPDTIPPPVFIRKFQAGGFDQPMEDAQTFSYGQNECTFEYIGLVYSEPLNVRYQTMLEGIDNNWAAPTERQSITYAGLQPGRYRFRVSAVNGDRVMSRMDASLQFTILQPFWKSMWFLATLAILLFSIGPFIFYRRTLVLKKEKTVQQEFSRRLIESQENERKRIAITLHDSIGQNLLIIKNQAVRAMDGKPADTAGRLKEISSLASETIGETREIAHNLRPALIERLGITEAIKSLVSRACEGTSIGFSAEIDQIDSIFSLENEMNLYRIIQESLNNILKHSGATEVSISLRVSDGALKLTVKDNGRGFIPENLAPGNQGFGLQSIKERVRILDGELSMHSAPGKGTIVEVRLSVKEKNNG